MRYLFDPQYFKDNQKILLFFANLWIGRWFFRLHGDRSSVKGAIIKIEPHRITWEENEQLKTEFRTHQKFSKRLFHGLYPVWWLCHQWDMVTKFAPQWNLGFDTLTCYPDADVESYTVDGFLGATGTNVTWATLTGSAGSNAYDADANQGGVYLKAGTTLDKYEELRRSIFLFKTSDLTSFAVISSAVLSIYSNSKSDGLSATPNVNIYSSAPASNTALDAGDFDSLGSTEFATSIAYADWSIVGYNDFTLNASGLAAISKTDISKFGARNANYDVANVAPNWVSGGYSGFSFYFADQTGVTKDPRLVVTYTEPLEINSVNSLINDANLQGYWRLESDGIDETANNNDLTAYSSPVHSTGKFGNGVDLELGDTDGYQNLSVAGIGVSGSQSWSAWIKPESINDSAVLSNDRLSLRGINLYSQSDGTISFETNGTTPAQLLSVATVSAGNWYHICGVYNAATNTKYIYVNGVSASVSVSGSPNARTVLYLGFRKVATSDGYSNFFDGMIDDAAIWDRALTDDEVLSIYDGTINSASPSTSPSISPSISQSLSPSLSPSKSPSISPSQSPSASLSPSKSPSISPSFSPSISPSQSPSASLSPSLSPSFSPSKSPSLSPSLSPSISPSVSPSLSGSNSLSQSISPSFSPSKSPSLSPSISQSKSPSISPSFSQSFSPSISPSPSVSQSLSPSVSQSYSPSISPSKSPSLSPSFSPSPSPSVSPSQGLLKPVSSRIINFKPTIKIK